MLRKSSSNSPQKEMEFFKKKFEENLKKNNPMSKKNIYFYVRN